MSSDSSDEENLEFLKEAQDTQLINDSMFSKTFEKISKNTLDRKNKESLPSLRKSKDEDAQFNFLKVTPAFRTFVAKKLSSKLDEKLKKILVNVEVEEIPRRKRKKSKAKGGVKLLSSSKTFLKTSETLENLETLKQQRNVKKPDRYNKLKVKVPEELLKEVAVSAEDILSQKEVKTWSNRSKAHVFEYKYQNQQLVLVEPKFK